MLGSIIHRVEFLALADMADAVSAVALEALCYAVLYEAAPFSFSLLVFGTIWDQCAQDVDSFLDLSLEDFHITTDIDIRRSIAVPTRDHITIAHGFSTLQCCQHKNTSRHLLWIFLLYGFLMLFHGWLLREGFILNKKEEHLPFTLGCIF